ncbi:hypothetical protein MAH4_27210 [Sessilibacter sp. MAH4]
MKRWINGVKFTTNSEQSNSNKSNYNKSNYNKSNYNKSNSETSKTLNKLFTNALVVQNSST